MKLGILTPVVRSGALVDPQGNWRHGAADWETTATIEDVVSIAVHAESLGYDFLSCAEHPALPVPVAAALGQGYWDPLTTLTFIAARTTRIRLATHVLVLPYHHPLNVAKSYGALDRFSNGRLILGVGIGGVEGEFAALGLDFRDRAACSDDALRAVRAAMSSRTPEYHGTHFSFGDIVVEPTALQPHVPIWVGGRSIHSLHRALALGDGWVPFGLDVPGLRNMLDAVRDQLDSREAPFDLVLPIERPLDPLGDPDWAHRVLDDHEALGTSAIDCSFVHQSLQHYLDQLSEMATIAAAHGGG